MEKKLCESCNYFTTGICTGLYFTDGNKQHCFHYSPKNSKGDNVKHPNHYIRGGLECIAVIKAAVIGLDSYEGYCTGNIIKYIWRFKFKNGIEDLKKAKQYIDFLIEHLEKEK